jgi:hypothetical protein
MRGDVEGAAVARFSRSVKTPFSTGFHGTNTAGFEDRVLFRCDTKTKLQSGVRHYSFHCNNKLSDKYTYSFDIYRKAKRATKPSPPSSSGCNPNYAGPCLPRSGDVDCSDISARNFRVIGTDVFKLDSDGDKIACEEH